METLFCTIIPVFFGVMYFGLWAYRVTLHPNRQIYLARARYGGRNTIIHLPYGVIQVIITSLFILSVVALVWLIGDCLRGIC